MRTTVEFPDDLFHNIKVEAAARGETIKEFLTRAASRELGTTVISATHRRMRLPLVGSDRPGAVDITNADIEEIFAAEDAEKADRS